MALYCTVHEYGILGNVRPFVNLALEGRGFPLRFARSLLSTNYFPVIGFAKLRTVEPTLVGVSKTRR